MAAGFMLCASGFIALSALCAKLVRTDLLGPPLDGIQVAHGRFLFAFLALWSVAAVLRPRFAKIHWGLHTARSALGATGITLLFTSVAFIPLADATAISFLNPIFAMLFAIPLLGERVGVWRAGAAVAALMGALILIRPSPEAFQPAALIALASAAVIGLEVILIKQLSGRERPFQILLVNNAIGLTLSTVAVLFIFTAPGGAQWLALVGVGLSMAAAQLCFVNSMRRADASYVLPFSYAALIFAALLDRFVFGAVPDAASLTGAAVIVLAACVLAWREGRQRRRERQQRQERQEQHERDEQRERQGRQEEAQAQCVAER